MADNLKTRLDNLERLTSDRVRELRVRALEKAVLQLDDLEFETVAGGDFYSQEYQTVLEKVFLLVAEEDRCLFGLQ